MTSDPYQIRWLIEHQVFSDTFGQSMSSVLRAQIAENIRLLMEPVIVKAMALGEAGAPNVPPATRRNPDGVLPKEVGVVFTAKFKDSPNPNWKDRTILFMRQGDATDGRYVMPHGAEWYANPDDGPGLDSSDLVQGAAIDPKSVVIMWEPPAPYQWKEKIEF